MAPLSSIRPRPLDLLVALAALLLLLIGGCGKSKPATRPDSGQTATKPASKPGGQVHELTLDPERVVIDEKAGTATLKADSGVKRASYKTWVFDLASYRAVVGDTLSKPVQVRVEEVSRTSKTHKPGPMEASPDGGIRLITIQARVISTRE